MLVGFVVTGSYNILYYQYFRRKRQLMQIKRFGSLTDYVCTYSMYFVHRLTKI